jgi:hypothetical protein
MEIPRETSGTWMTLMDYAAKNGVSLSTLRRHIKAQKLIYKIEEGRYLLWDEDPNSSPSQSDLYQKPASHPTHQAVHQLTNQPTNQNDPLNSVQILQARLQRVTQDLKHAQEEIAELKTLIALYEEKIPPQRFNN